MTLDDCLARPVVWSRTATAEVPYRAQIDGGTWEVRINDFPAEPMYSLLIAGRPIGDFEDWPSAWQRPAG